MGEMTLAKLSIAENRDEQHERTDVQTPSSTDFSFSADSLNTLVRVFYAPANNNYILFDCRAATPLGLYYCGEVTKVLGRRYDPRTWGSYARDEIWSANLTCVRQTEGRDQISITKGDERFTTVRQCDSAACKGAALRSGLAISLEKYIAEDAIDPCRTLGPDLVSEEALLGQLAK
ncbi:MAG: hypothetical protein ACD_62C00460G0008 [uncultured bacterium]|nr:MAG: hypothetical protein ACD_62C00460G0008 [uncultured bacterium]